MPKASIVGWSAGLGPALWHWNAEVSADFPRQMIIDFIVARNRTPTIETRVVPPGVPRTLAE